MAQSTNFNRRRNFQQNYTKPQWVIDAENAEREKQEEIARKLENTEENFPSLGGSRPEKTGMWGAAGKFKELAAEWKEEDDRRKAEEEESKKKKGDTGDDSIGFVLPQFNPRRRFVEAEEEGESSPAPPLSEYYPGSREKPDFVEDDDSGWTTVDSRSKKQSRTARKHARKDAELRRLDELGDTVPDNDQENDEDENGEKTCWTDGPQAHETCWDDGRHP